MAKVKTLSILTQSLAMMIMKNINEYRNTSIRKIIGAEIEQIVKYKCQIKTELISKY